jgi:hypothetical protein
METVRKRGRPKGYPKSGGRAKGVTNKSTAEIRNAALRLCPEMLKVLASLARHSETDNVRKDAAIAVLQWGIGKPKEMHEHSGPDGGAIPMAADVKVHDKLESLAGRLLDRIAKRDTQIP